VGSDFRTLHITNAWHRGSGGIATFYRALLAAAERARHSMRLVVPAEEDGEESVGAYGVIYRIRSPRAPLDSNYRLIMPGSYLGRNTRLWKILEREQPDLVEICDKYTMPYLGGLLRIGKYPAVRKRVAVVGQSCERMDQNFAAYLGGGPAARAFCRWYMKWIYFPQCDHHIANSAATAGELQEASRGHKVERGVWIRPMGVDFDRFAQPERYWDAPEGAFTLVYAGRLAPEKNLGLLFDTLALLPDRFRLLLAGEGILRTKLEARAQAFPGRVSFLGHLDGAEALVKLYREADAFVHPNPREPFGIGPLEAMAAGLPVVAPDQGGVVTYLSETNGWPTPPDPASFAGAIQAIVQDPAATRERIRQGVLTAARYRWDRIADGFLDLYRELYTRTVSGDRAFRIPPSFLSTRGNWLGQEI
jgi:alpha-1,6-mannosyltransferase